MKNITEMLENVRKRCEENPKFLEAKAALIAKAAKEKELRLARQAAAAKVLKEKFKLSADSLALQNKEISKVSSETTTDC